MRTLGNKCLTLTAVFLSSIFNIALAQEIKVNNTKLSQLSIPHTSDAIEIDGELDDKAWQQALLIPLDIVNAPWNNLPSPVKTDVRIIEDGENIYISFFAEDPDPENIKGFLGDRDTKWGDDVVGLKLDTFNSRRLNYKFFVNPYGVQNDGITNEITGEDNNLWDGIWHSFGKITKHGYQVEMAIPYNILNFEQSNEEKIWAIELIRLYPRNERLRISHIQLDRNNDCFACQMPEIKGFKQAKIDKNIMLTPATVATNNQTRDIYDNDAGWEDDNNFELGLDVRWGITPSTLLNITLNPDFSTVESDAGQLSVNTNFSLFYDEKRSFFLENSEYFSSNYDLVYTRNIADPDYGVKITGREKQHSYGFFVTNDNETNFIIPGSINSNLASVNSKSTAGAFNYRFNHNENLSLGFISTLRSADNYHNVVAGFDGKYRLSDTNSVLAQVLHSNTEYPDEVVQNYYSTDASNYYDDFSDQAIKIDFKHVSEYWSINAGHQQIGKDFRADLGFMTKADYQQDDITVSRTIYNEGDSFWQEANLVGEWRIHHNEKGELLERKVGGTFGFTGPKMSYFDIMLNVSDKVGLRQDKLSLAIEGNTTLFTEKELVLYGHIQPTSRIHTSATITLGDKIDYSNNRLGDYIALQSSLTVNVTDHLEVDLFYTYSKLDAFNELTNIKGSVYKASLTDLRISYQFDVRSYLKLNIGYSDVERNPDNNPMVINDNYFTEKDRNFSTQLIYSYKLNPQTVFFLGYSDNSYQDDSLDKLERDQRTFFSKISYAWM
ncbi:MAG: carbohydrate binding family 9 domain-containing protein [Alteromonadaceae bacterium]|nr:carbohydrate binding family 9 domain-containing protein [Alteromonadaceae bacterium]